jgi:hypothetical protein
VDAHDLERHIEACKLGPCGEPLRGGASETATLLHAHHLDRLTEVESRTHLHLAEDDVRAAAYDQVDLTAANAYVPPEDLVSAEKVVDRGAALRRPAGS